ncbi:MAG: MotA/TolQ/ExbB proton channel family protein [Planctomycetota bacterium]|nr:MotA/TolQ/ExbB proton channel family protein [Planctomycetota bacterium]
MTIASLHCFPARAQGHSLVHGILVGLAVLALTTASPVSSSYGQDASTAEVLSEVAPETPAPDPPESGKRRSLFDTLADGGLVGVLIGLLSMIAVGFVVEHFIHIRHTTMMPENLVLDLEELIHDGQLEEATELCKDPSNDSLIAHVVLAGLERFQGSQFGFAEYKAAVEEAGEDQTGRLYRKTEVLNLIGSIAPMLGLTGTVLGMIDAFNQIAASGGMAKPDQLAAGIGQALVTTLMGLVVAIPTMIAFSFFRNRIDSIVAEAGKRVEQILTPLGQRRS